MTLPQPRQRALIAVSAFLVAITWIAFWPCLENGFVNSDDQANFLDNHDYRGLGWAQIQSAFTKPRLGVYQPIGSLVLSVQYVLFGMNPGGYHLASVLFHSINAVLLFLVIHAIACRVMPSSSGWLAVACGIATALFAIHPLRTEPVAWATAQLYLVGGGFSLLSVLAYLRAFRDPDRTDQNWLLGSYSLALASMLSMPGAVSLPLIFLILDSAILKRRNLVEKAPFFVMAVVVAIAAMWAKQHDAMLVEPGHDGIFARLAQACYGVWFPLSRTIFPVGITGYYPRPELGNFFSTQYIGIVAIVGVAAIAVGFGQKRWKWLLPASLAFLAMIAPHLGFLRVGNTIAADRYGYAASTSLAVLLGIGLCRLFETKPRTMIPLTLLGCLVACGLMVESRGYSRTWHDSESLWKQAESQYPQSSDIHLGLGSSISDPNRLDEAIAEYDRALEIRPGWPKALVSKGAVLARLGRFDEAIRCDREALQAWPNFHTAHLNLGLALAATGKIEAAEAEYRTVLRLEPNHAEAHQKLGALLLQQNQVEKAIVELDAALRIVPSHAEALSNMGIAIGSQGKLDPAVRLLRKSLESDPSNLFVRTNLGIFLAQMGRLDDAKTELKTVVESDSTHVPSRIALGAVLAQKGEADGAIAEFQEVLKIDPSNVQARSMLAQVVSQSDPRTARR